MKKIPLEIRNICIVHALVDDDDYEKIKDYNWQVMYKHGNFYVEAHHRHGEKGKDSRRKKVTYKLHRLLMGLDKTSNLVVDHIDGDGLNNTRKNLRVCTRAENSRNNRARKPKGTSKYKGVYKDSWTKTNKKWKASISVDGTTTHIGRFETEILAAEAYNKAAIKHYGNFANVNKIG